MRTNIRRLFSKRIFSQNHWLHAVCFTVAWLVTGLVVLSLLGRWSFLWLTLSGAFPGKYIFKDLSDSDIVITPVEVHLGRALVQSKSIGSDLGELYTKVHTSNPCSSSGHGEVVVETGVIYLETGSDQEEHTHTLDFSQWGGRFVKDHMAFYTAARVIEMFKKLRDTSVKERLELIKNGKESSPNTKRTCKFPFGIARI